VIRDRYKKLSSNNSNYKADDEIAAAYREFHADTEEQEKPEQFVTDRVDIISV